MSGLNDQHLLFTVKRPNIVMQKGDGVYLYDASGKRYLDAIGGWAVTCLGHNHPVMQEALVSQAKELWNASAYFLNRPMLDFSQFLAQKSGLERVFFCSTGAEANESAIKLARKYGTLKKQGAYEIITLKNSFHGRTLASMSATGKEAWKDLYEPKVPGFKHVPINDIEALKAAVSDKSVAIMLEPIQGEGGVYACEHDYLKQVRQLCDEKKVLLIFDEVQTGIGRTGTFFCFEQSGIKPDILSLGKGLGGGYPIAAMLAREALNSFEPGEQGGTYCAQPLGMAVGLAVCQHVAKPSFLKQVRDVGAYFIEQLHTLSQSKAISHIRGKGLLLAFDCKQDAFQLAERLLEKGLIVNASSKDTIRIIPPLIFTQDHVDEAMSYIDQVMAYKSS